MRVCRNLRPPRGRIIASDGTEGIAGGPLQFSFRDGYRARSSVNWHYYDRFAFYDFAETTRRGDTLSSCQKVAP